MNDRALDSFVHLTDFHFWEIVKNPLLLFNKRIIGATNVALRRRREFVQSRADFIADEVASVGIARAILTGDFSSTATEREMRMGAEFVRGLERRGLSPWVIAGNHDVYTFESARKRRFERHLGEWTPGAGLPCTVQMPGGTPVVFVPTVCPNWISSKGYIHEEQAEAVGSILEKFDYPAVVAGHYPVLFETDSYSTGENRRLRNADALREALGRARKPVLYISGHVHRFSFTRDRRHENVSHLTTGAFFRRDRESGIEGEFSEIHVDPAGFRVIRHLFGREWESTPVEATVGG